MTTYQSLYTGEEIDEGIALAKTALQAEDAPKPISTFTAMSTDARVYADSSVPPAAAPDGSSGWYFKNTQAGHKINWYLFAGVNTQYADVQSAFAVVNFRNTTSRPFLGFFSAREEDGQDASWFRSRWVFGAYETPVAAPGVYVLFIGTDPGIRPELPRIRLNASPGSTIGPLDPSETLLTYAWNTSSGSPVNTEDFVFELAGHVIDGAVSLINFVVAGAGTPEGLATVATTGDYGDLLNTPTLGTAAASDVEDFATAAQGALADSALQPGDVPSGGIPEYATVNDLPMSGVTQGTLALVRTTLQGDSAVFLWNGSESAGGWYKLASVNLAPTIVTGTEPAYLLPNDGTPLVLSLVAEDPEGLPISWGYSVAAGDPVGLVIINETSDGVFEISADPAAIASQLSGIFSLTFSATDGVSVAGTTSEFTLSFAVPSSLLGLFFRNAPRAVTFNLLNAFQTDSSFDTTVRATAWMTQDFGLAACGSASQNPTFFAESNGTLVEQLFSVPLLGAGKVAERTGAAGASKNGRWGAVVGDNYPYVAFYELVGGEPVLREYSGDPEISSPGESVAFHPANRWVVVSDDSSGVVVFDLQSGTPTVLGRNTYGLTGDAFLMSFSADGNHLYFVENAGGSTLVRAMDFNATTGTLSNLRTVPNAPTTAVAGLDLNKDGTRLSVCSNASVVLDVSGGPNSATVVDMTAIGVESFSGKTLRHILFSPDDNWIAVVLAASPYLELYSLVDGVATRETVPAVASGNVIVWASFSPGN